MSSTKKSTPFPASAASAAGREASGPAAALQHQLAGLAACLRLWVPILRRLADELHGSLAERDALPHLLEAAAPLPYPASLWARVDGLLAESLCGAIAHLEAMAALSPQEPDRPPREALEIWRELDPGAVGAGQGGGAA